MTWITGPDLLSFRSVCHKAVLMVGRIIQQQQEVDPDQANMKRSARVLALNITACRYVTYLGEGSRSVWGTGVIITNVVGSMLQNIYKRVTSSQQRLRMHAKYALLLTLNASYFKLSLISEFNTFFFQIVFRIVNISHVSINLLLKRVMDTREFRPKKYKYRKKRFHAHMRSSIRWLDKAIFRKI